MACRQAIEFQPTLSCQPTTIGTSGRVSILFLWILSLVDGWRVGGLVVGLVVVKRGSACGKGFMGWRTDETKRLTATTRIAPQLDGSQQNRNNKQE